MFPPDAEIGSYRVVSRLGAGGMGEVYLAEDTRLRRPVALKILPEGLTGDERSRKRLMREARAAATLDHPNVCTVYDVGEDAGRTFIAMQYVEGETLAARLARGPIDLAAALSIARQIASALAEAHRHAIVHRDVKPHNIMLSSGDRVRVLDFGLAMLSASEGGAETMTALSSTTTIAGTVPYMSPEQVRGEPLDARSDIFSFGVLLYELVSGVRPFSGGSAAETLAAILTREAPAIQRSGPPAEVQRIIRKCLEKDRDRRYQNTQDLVIDLDNAARDLSGAPVVAVSKSEPQVRPTRRVARYAIAAAGVLVVAAAGAFYMIRLGRGSQPLSNADFVPMTNFADSVSAPALSPDGRMVAFIRGGGWFLSTGQIYVKLLPDGDAVPLTDDPRPKYGPAFSPDGSHVTYTLVSGSDSNSSWDTWSVPVFGGPATKLLPNASGLTWLDDRRVLFSEIESGSGLHMGIVTATADRGDERRVYFPEQQRAMAHFSVASPDRRWVLVVEMDRTQRWQRCRLVPYDGSSPARPLGPEGECIAAAWSPDGRFMYFSATVNGTSHLWRQRFPDGPVEPLTSGSTTEEEGLAISPDGRSLVTSVGRTQHSLWIHDGSGDRVVPLEGQVENAVVSPDGRRAYCLVQKAQDSSAFGITIVDIASGKADRMLSEFPILDFDVSEPKRAVAFTTTAKDGTREIWMASLDRRAAPRRVTTKGNRVHFAGAHELVFEALTDRRNTVERIADDGSGRRRILEHPIVALHAVSPDGEWAVVGSSGIEGTFALATEAVPVHGGTPRLLCPNLCQVRWSPDGRYFYMDMYPSTDDHRTLVFPVQPGHALPDFPGDRQPDAAGWARLTALPAIDRSDVSPGPDPAVYLFTQETTLSNLFRVPLR